MAKLTPMMKQYRMIKEDHKDAILFFRLGDFYEMFFEDAETASRILEITLTSRDAGKGKRVPMCGIPYHAADSYIPKLLKAGYNIAVCEQVEDPASAKGLVERDVVRIITPGTVFEPEFLPGEDNNYLLGIAQSKSSLGIAVIDVSTGEFRVAEEDCGARNPLEVISDYIARFAPSEIVAGDDLQTLAGIEKTIPAKTLFEVIETPYDSEAKRELCEQFAVQSLASFGLNESPAAVLAAAVVMRYLKKTHKRTLPHITSIGYLAESGQIHLDTSTVRNLELIETMRTGKREGSLFWVLDRTTTPMGKRTLKSWIIEPLSEAERINERLDAVSELAEDAVKRGRLVQALKGIYDMERLLARLSGGKARARELILLKSSLGVLPFIRDLLVKSSSSLLARMGSELPVLADTYKLVDQSISEDAPAVLTEGGLIKDGFAEEVDRLRSVRRNDLNWIAELEQREKERTGVKSLKVGFNKVFGYYIEVTRPNLALVPDDYTRKQTLANSERFTTPELKEREQEIVEADEKLKELEYRLFCEIRDKVVQQARGIQQAARIIGRLDALVSLALCAQENHYVRPTVDNKDRIIIRQGRHPVVEQMLDHRFVPNDAVLDGNSRLLLITGPNMGGKSTYMRQVGLIVLLAQIGSFVPAEEAAVGVVDRIFTRAGASDDLATGQSTFMLEMQEVANILHNASERSLLILDEVGRGTSTFDGMSIARAVLEYIARVIGAKTLFATHYHELTSLEGAVSGLANLAVSVHEEGDEVVFLYTVKPGKADRSYGIQVARLAGLPNMVIEHAGQILRELEGSRETAAACPQVPDRQSDLFSAKRDEVLEKVASLEPDNLTPKQALDLLYDLTRKARELTGKGGRSRDH